MTFPDPHYADDLAREHDEHLAEQDAREREQDRRDDHARARARVGRSALRLQPDQLSVRRCVRRLQAREDGGVMGESTTLLTIARQERDAEQAARLELCRALVGGDPLDPRWTWLPGVIERLEEHAPADEDPDAMYEAARVLWAMYDDLRRVLPEADRA